MPPDRPAVVLHIGAMKTGTTYVQQRLLANQAALAEAGVLVPGGEWWRQVRAVQDALRLDRRDPHVRRETRGAWTAVARAMAEHAGPSVLSMEFLSFARPRQARAVVASLAPADVDVVLTVRDAQAVVPAQWQTSVQSRSRLSWPEYQAGVRAAPSRGPGGRWRWYAPNAALRSFLRAQDVARMLEVWGAVVPADRLHVVTVPTAPSAPDLLWRRVCAAARIDPDLAPQQPATANASLGFASTELVRLVNGRIGRVRLTDYNATVRRQLAQEVLGPRAAAEGRAQLDTATRAAALAWNERTRAAVAASGAAVVGALDDLPVVAPPGPAPAYVAAPDTAAVLEAAVVAAVGLDRFVRRLVRRRRRAGEDVPLPETQPASDPQRWSVAPDPAGAAAAEVAALCRLAIEHRRRLLARRGPADDASLEPSRP